MQAYAQADTGNEKKSLDYHYKQINTNTHSAAKINLRK